MLSRRFVLLIAACLLGSGAYLGARRVLGRRQPEPARRQDAPRIEPDAQPTTPEREEKPESAPFVSLTSTTLRSHPRMAALIVAAIVLGTAAYLGLGGNGDGQVTVLSAQKAYAEAASTPAAVLEQKRERMLSTADTGLLPPAAPVAAEVAAAPPQAVDAIAAETPAPITPAPPTPVPTPAPPPQPPAPVPADGLEALICAKPWPCGEAIAVARCESGTDMNGRLDGNWATNGNNYGLFQINSIHSPRFPGFFEHWMDPVQNIEWAFTIWSEQGWYPWHCQPY